jgi:predicted dithiol-disulfide oxidoreductase (DUF899 family)
VSAARQALLAREKAMSVELDALRAERRLWLDLVPKGRNEADTVMSWLKLHDAYTTDAQKTR